MNEGMNLHVSLSINKNSSPSVIFAALFDFPKFCIPVLVSLFLDCSCSIVFLYFFLSLTFRIVFIRDCTCIYALNLISKRFIFRRPNFLHEPTESRSTCRLLQYYTFRILSCFH